MVYWLTNIECPNRDKHIKITEEAYKERLMAELRVQPSNGWPSPERGWSLGGLVKIGLGKGNYELKCFTCNYSVNEKDYKKPVRARGRRRDFLKPKHSPKYPVI